MKSLIGRAIEALRRRNSLKYLAIIGGPMSFAPEVTGSGDEDDSAIAKFIGEEYLGAELSKKLYREAGDLRMKLAPEVKAKGGDLIVRIEVYERKP